MALNLIDFQRDLIARLQKATAQDAAATKLGFHAGGQAWLADLGDVAEVLPLPPIVPVPLTRAWFRGVANIRGGLYGVIDFGAYCGGTPVADTLQTRLVLLRGAAKFGLAVDRLAGICHMERFKLEPVERAGYVAAEYSDEAGIRWKQLDLKTLGADPALSSIAAQTQNAVVA